MVHHQWRGKYRGFFSVKNLQENLKFVLHLCIKAKRTIKAEALL
jgi:hypothetical protein